jgi:hypothetical protein
MFARVLKLGSALIGAIAAVGGAIGYLTVGLNGLYSALIGAALALIFVSMTALSILIGGKLPLGGFFGVVMGGWILKLVGFIVAMKLLVTADFIDGPVLFFTIVASVLGTLALDAIVVMRTRIPTFEN